MHIFTQLFNIIPFFVQNNAKMLQKSCIPLKTEIYTFSSFFRYYII